MYKLNNNDKDFIKNCKKVQQGKLTLEQLLDTLNLRFYVPIETKMAVADIVTMLISNKANLASTTEFEAIFGDKLEEVVVLDIIREYELIKFAFTMAQYVGVCISNENCDSLTYDLIHEIGLYNYILDKSKGDLTKFENIIDDMSGIRYYALTYSIQSLVVDIPTQEKLNEFKKTIESIDKDKIKNMQDIMNFNNPMLGEISKAIDTNVIEQIMQSNNNQ